MPDVPIEKLDTYFRDAINQLCRLPRISKADAFTLWHAAHDLIGAIAALRKVSRRLGTLQIAVFVKSLCAVYRVPAAVRKLALALIRSIGSENVARNYRRK